MEGRGRFSAAPVSVEGTEGEPELWPRLMELYGRRLQHAIGQLPRSQRVALVGRVDGRTCRDVAAELGVSRWRVDRAKNAGLAALRRALGPPPSHDALLALPVESNTQEVSAMKLASNNKHPNQDALAAKPSKDATLSHRRTVTSGEYLKGGHSSPVVAARRGAPAVAELRCAAPGCDRHLVRGSGRASDAHYCPQQQRPNAKRPTRAGRFANQTTSKALVSGVVPAYEEADALVTANVASESIRATITPALALALLERNRDNRTVSEMQVERYARDMARGQWPLNNQALGFGADGDLYDGQHRLLAVLHAEVAVEMLVVRGMPAEARATIDQGRARSVGDALRIVDGIENGARTTAYVRALRLLVSKRRGTVSPADVRAAMVEYAPTLVWFSEHGPKAQPYNRAAVVGALIYAHHVAPAAVETFVNGYVGGVGPLCQAG